MVARSEWDKWDMNGTSGRCLVGKRDKAPPLYKGGCPNPCGVSQN